MGKTAMWSRPVSCITEHDLGANQFNLFKNRNFLQREMSQKSKCVAKSWNSSFWSDIIIKMQVDTAKTSHSCAVMRKILQNHDVLNTWERCPVPKLLFRSYDFMNNFVIRSSDNTISPVFRGASKAWNYEYLGF